MEGEFDEAYEKRLFCQFEHHPMPCWDERDHRDCLTRRAKLRDKEPTDRQLAKIDAYSRFTGGNARTAAVLAASIPGEQDPISPPCCAVIFTSQRPEDHQGYGDMPGRMLHLHRRAVRRRQPQAAKLLADDLDWARVKGCDGAFGVLLLTARERR